MLPEDPSNETLSVVLTENLKPFHVLYAYHAISEGHASFHVPLRLSSDATTD